MAENKAELIMGLCNSWINTVRKSDGAIAIGVESERFRLRYNDIVFHELSFEEVNAACIGLSRVLLLKGLNTIIDLDHIFFWSWIAELILYRESDYFTKDEREIRILFETVIRCTLAGVTPPVNNKEEWERQRQLNQLTEFNTRELILNKSLIQTYLVFPLLEAVVKKACSEYVDYSGKVLKDFSVITKDGTTRKYTKGNVCSSLRNLLYLLHNNVADEYLRADLENLRQHFSELDEQDPYDLIYQWRNSSMHGESTFPTIGGSLLNLVILIVLNHVKSNYEILRNKVFEHVVWNIRTHQFTGIKSSWNFYPPF